MEKLLGSEHFKAAGRSNKIRHGISLTFRATADHVVPISHGGRTSMDNLVTSCWNCNYGKYNGVRIISKKSSKRMQTAVSDLEPYGFALETPATIIDGISMVGHTGSAYGLFSAMFFNPSKKFGIVVISNGCHPGNSKGYNAVIKKTVNALYENLILNN